MSRETALTSRAIEASRWYLSGALAQAGLQMVVLAVLSRLLPPRDFGVFGVATILLGFARLFSGLGIGPALVQRRELEEKHLRTALTLLIVATTFLAVVLWFLTPAWSHWIGSPEATGVGRILALALLLGPVGELAHARLWRRLRAREIVLADLAGYGLGYGVVGLVVAARNPGPEALGWAVVGQAVARAGILVFMAGEAPRPGWDRPAARDLMRFGAGLSLTRLSNFAAGRGDYLVVGKALDPTSLGLYERAFRLIDLSSKYLAGVLDRVLFPALAEAQGDSDRLQRAYVTAMSLIGLTYLPASVVLALVAPELVESLFGPAWIPAAPPLRLLALMLFFRAAYKVSDSLVRAQGAVYRGAWRAALYAVLVVAGAAAGARWGVAGVAAGVGVAIFAKYALTTGLCLQLLGLSWAALLKGHRAGLALAGAALVVVSAVRPLGNTLTPGAMVGLCIALLTALLSILLTARLLPDRWYGPDVLNLLKAVGSRVRGGSRLLHLVLGGRRFHGRSESAPQGAPVDLE